MQITNTKNIVKYLIFTGIIFAVLKIVPTKQLTIVEILSLVTVILIGIYSLECLTAKNTENMSNIKENMENTKENMDNTDPQVFDLDMDIDLDFDKNNLKETHDPTGNQKLDEDSDMFESDEDSDMFESDEEPRKKRKGKKRKGKKGKGKKQQKEKDDQEIGLNMDEIRDELRKRNLDDILKEEKVFDNRLEDNNELTDEMKVEIEKSRIASKEELEEQLSDKILTFDKDPVNCEVEVAKMRREMQETITKLKQELLAKNEKTESGPFAKKYVSMLIADLLEKQILDKNDVENINAKLISGASSLEETIMALERLRAIGKPKNVSDSKDTQNDMKYSDLPSDYYNPLGDKIANQWDNEFTILNTDKWQVPQPRPPVCISSGPCKVCPDSTSGYPVNLKDFDDSRVISNVKINKQWALDQADSS